MILSISLLLICFPSLYSICLDVKDVQLPKESIMGPEKMNAIAAATATATSFTAMSDTDIYKNGFRLATLNNLETKYPLPKDERVALCHYHPEVRPYLFWPKNTPASQKYAIPTSLATKLGNEYCDNIAIMLDHIKCQGLNTTPDGKYCYILPTYSFEEARREILTIETDFFNRVRQKIGRAHV